MPTCENMWGVIIFLRFYTIVGQSGIIEALTVVLISFIAAFLTTISLSAIASSGSGLKNGGPYYMISRSLGPYIGVSIGIVYYFGITLLGVLEVLGAVETFHNSTGTEHEFPGSTQLLCILVFVLMLILIWFGQKILNKIAVICFGVVCVTIVLFFMGICMAPFNSDPDGLTGLESSNFTDNLEPDHDSTSSFSVSLAIFFPTFVAIFSGADRSKKLRNPAKDIPKGTFAAIILSALMYAAFMILWGGVGHREYLKGNLSYFDEDDDDSITARRLGGGPDKGQVVKDISIVPPVIIETGIIIACISLSIQCLIVAPNIM